MSIVYFDICSIPLFLMILFVCFSRKMTQGSTNRLFIATVLLSLFSTVADLGMEVTSNMAPMPEPARIIVDHIVPHRGDMLLFWDQENWQALCKACHDQKTGHGL